MLNSNNAFLDEVILKNDISFLKGSVSDNEINYYRFSFSNV